MNTTTIESLATTGKVQGSWPKDPIRERQQEGAALEGFSAFHPADRTHYLESCDLLSVEPAPDADISLLGLDLCKPFAPYAVLQKDLPLVAATELAKARSRSLALAQMEGSLALDTRRTLPRAERVKMLTESESTYLTGIVEKILPTMAKSNHPMKPVN